ncbi:MAG: diguanylate cyclase [Spirochaetes bacterium]|nr:diguanylate cyclase [Spirochaetota bacterium]
MNPQKKYDIQNGRDLSILIIDDEQIVLKTVDKILQYSNPNYYIKTATNVQDALELIEKTYWDTILLDLSLPKKEGERPNQENGLYLLDILTKELKITPPIIAMTGFGDDELSDIVLDKGAYYFLHKPVKPKSLQAIVKNATKLQEAGFDGLTGLLNRKTFEERLKREFERVKRKNQTILNGTGKSSEIQSYLSLIFVDGDNFKQINDSYSHLVGDQVLKKISSLFIDEALYKYVHKEIPDYVNIIRPYDVASRFGGDEFTIFLPETNHENAYMIGKRINEMVKEFNISEIVGADNVQNNVKHFSLSIGIATYPVPNNVENHKELIELADSAMYAAKKKREGEIFGYDENGKTVRLS